MNVVSKLARDIRTRYPKWSLPTKLGLFLGIASVILGILGLIVAIPPLDKPIQSSKEKVESVRTHQIQLLTESVHLGDNIFPIKENEQYPYDGTPNDVIFEASALIFDKQRNELWSPKPELLKKIKPEYIAANFNRRPTEYASSNLEMVDVSALQKDEQYFRIGPDLALRESENGGNYYLPKATVGLVGQFDLGDAALAHKNGATIELKITQIVPYNEDAPAILNVILNNEIERIYLHKKSDLRLKVINFSG